jgi:uncharacterized protein DUF4350
MNSRTWRTALMVSFGGIVALSVCQHGALAKAPPSVLVDEGHGQKFLIETYGRLDLSELAAAFRAAGAHVQSSKQPLTDARLRGVDGLTISGAFASFTTAEIDSIMRFLNRGGRLALMLHIPQPVAPLLHRLGVDFSNGVIRERQNVIGDDPLNFHVTALHTHALTHKLDSLAVFGAWALLSTSTDTETIAQTSAEAWVDLNRNNTLDKGDAVQSFGVVVVGQVGGGRFVVFGDDAIFQNQFLKDGNAVLARNLVCWLTRTECK